MRSYFPSSINVAGRDCWVIGNDREAVWKAGRLAESGAHVTWVAPHLDQKILDQFRQQNIKIEIREFTLADLKDQFFVVLSARDNPGLAEQVWRRCRERRILLCAIDLPQFCDVVNVSFYQKGRLKIMISTDGAAPGVSRKIREGLEESLKDVPMDSFLDDLAALRRRLEETVPDGEERRKRLLKAIEGFEFRADVKLPASAGKNQR